MSKRKPTSSLSNKPKRVKAWTEADVSKWLVDEGLAEYSKNFKGKSIDGDTLLSLSDSGLKDLGISKVGQRKTLLASIAMLEEASETASPEKNIASLAAKNGPEDKDTKNNVSTYLVDAH